MARKDVKEESDYHGIGEMTITVQVIPVMLYESVEAPRFPYQKRIQKTGDLNLATEVLEGFDRIPVALKATATE